LIKDQCEIFNFVDLCSGVGIAWSTTAQTRVSDATAVTFSVKCFNPLKLYPLSGNISGKVVCFILFIHSRAFNNNVISNGESYCCNVHLHHCWQRIFKNAHYFYAVGISISLAILSEVVVFF